MSDHLLIDYWEDCSCSECTALRAENCELLMENVADAVWEEGDEE